MTNEQDKPDKFMEILCDPTRGPVEWERPVSWCDKAPASAPDLRAAYRCGLIQGMAGMRSLECHGPEGCAAAYAIGWMRGAFPRPFAAEDSETAVSDDSDA